jgi:hypothetical protein
VGGERALQASAELVESLGEAVAAGALQEAERPVQDRGGDAVAGKDRVVVDPADRLVRVLRVALDP